MVFKDGFQVFKDDLSSGVKI